MSEKKFCIKVPTKIRSEGELTCSYLVYTSRHRLHNLCTNVIFNYTNEYCWNYISGRYRNKFHYNIREGEGNIEKMVERGLGVAQSGGLRLYNVRYRRLQ